MKTYLQKNPVLLLQWATVCVFAGRAWQHLFWDAPYREIIWDPDLMGGLVATFTSLSWGEFVTHPMGDVYIQRMVIGQGVFFVLCSLVAVFIRQLPTWTRAVLLLGAFDLVLLALSYLKDHFMHLGQFLEYSLQFSAPVFLVLLLEKKLPSRSLALWLKIMVVLTFTCHGLYALGYYPRPGTFFTMTENILGLGKTGTIHFLNTVGVLDFLVAVGIFLPYRWAKYALAYAVFWGFVTSFARIAGYFYWEYPLSSLHQHLHEFVLRAPHFLVPLYLLLVGGLRPEKTASPWSDGQNLGQANQVQV